MAIEVRQEGISEESPVPSFDWNEIILRPKELDEKSVDRNSDCCDSEWVAVSVAEESSPPLINGSKWPQVFAAVSANLGALAFGTVLAWSATGIESLEEATDFKSPSHVEQSWIGSIALLGALFSCPFAGFGLVKKGRRKTMLYLTIPFILGWLLIGLAQNVWMILLGRFITGLCGGAFSVTAPIFTGETADASIRGGLGSLFDLQLSLGMLYIYVIGGYTTWRVQAYACILIPISFHIIMYFIPESPRYLVENDKTVKAQKAICWLKGMKKSPELVKWQLAELEKSVEEGRLQKFRLKDSLKRPVLRPTLIMCGIMFFTTMSGVDAVVAYTVEIFKSAGSSIDPNTATVIIGATQVLSTIPAAIIVDHAGRRPLLMASSTLMSISLTVLGLFFYMKRTEDILFGLKYTDILIVPLVTLIAFVISYSIGFGPLSMMMCGELLPNNMKGLTTCVVLMSRWLLAFVVLYTFELMNEDVNIPTDFIYWTFAIVCICGTLFVFICVPETMGRTLDEIQIYFIKTKKKQIVTESKTDLVN